MRFALVDNELTEAKPELKGICPGCSQPVIARCGIQRIHHWAHSRKVMCDNWWEPETQWHRSWKNNYPVEWQEIFLPDEKTGEKHIADVRTAHDLVIEFQHSHLDPKERHSREKFYGNMIWVVDGTRLKRDYLRFSKGSEKFIRTNKRGFFFVDFPQEVFPADWLNGSVPVIFDFRDRSAADRDERRSVLWCLLPQRAQDKTVVVGLRPEDFVKITHNNRRLFTGKEEQRQTEVPPAKPPVRREPQYILERGKWKMRRRF